MGLGWHDRDWEPQNPMTTVLLTLPQLDSFSPPRPSALASPLLCQSMPSKQGSIAPLPPPSLGKHTEGCLTVVQMVGLNDLLWVVRNTGTFNLERVQNKGATHQKHNQHQFNEWRSWGPQECSDLPTAITAHFWLIKNYNTALSTCRPAAPPLIRLPFLEAGTRPVFCCGGSHVWIGSYCPTKRGCRTNQRCCEPPSMSLSHPPALTG